MTLNAGDMKDDPMQDDMEMDLDVEDEEEEMDMDAEDMGELTLTDEEAEVFLKVADKVRAAMETPKLPRNYLRLIWVVMRWIWKWTPRWTLRLLRREEEGANDGRHGQ